VSVTAAPRSRGIEVPRVSRAAAVGALGVALVATELVLRSETSLRAQIAGQLVAFAIFLPAAWLCWRGLGVGRAGVVVVVGIAVALRVACFDPSAPPPLTNDTHRYAWDARVQAAGINPYRYAPAAPELRHLRDAEIWPGISRKDWKTVYPPGAEASYLAARTVFGNGLRATTWLFLLTEAAAVGLLVLVLARERVPLERVAVAAWHPLAVSEIAGNGHVDALALLAGAGLLAAWSLDRRALAGVAAGFGALVKLGPFFLVPALARRGGRRFVLASLACVGVGVAAYGSVGRGIAGDLDRYLDEDLGSFAWYFLSRELGRESARTALLVVLLAIVAFVALRAHDRVEQVARTGLLVLGGVLLTTAFLQPWYALWLLPFLVLTAAPAWLWLTGTLPLLYVFGIDGGPLPWWVRAAIYGPFFALALLHLVRPPRATPVRLGPLREPSVAVVIPALDEVAALPAVLRELPRESVDEVVVVDGGSTDGTRKAAGAGGARVVLEPRSGYGRACLTGVEATTAEVVVFMDGDGSDDPADLPRVLEPVLSGEAALALGRRRDPEEGAQHFHQRIGNRLVSALVRWWYGAPVRDIPPFRAVRRDVLTELALTEMTYGWPTEMVVKAARTGFPVVEVPVASRARRGGESKVSGRLVPSLRAGARMLVVVARHS
jgi:Glycosyl transferase family 2